MALASFVPVKSRNLRVGRYLVKTGETIAVGDPVEIDSNGLLVCATATSDYLAGVAAEACTSSAAGTVIGVFDDPKQVYRGKCDDYSQNVQAKKGDKCDIVGSTGAFYLNLDATAKQVVRVVDVGSFVDAQLGAAASDFFSFNTGNHLYFEIAAHAFAS